MQLMQCILEFGILAELFIIMCLLAVIWQQICEKKGGRSTCISESQRNCKSGFRRRKMFKDSNRKKPI